MLTLDVFEMIKRHTGITVDPSRQADVQKLLEQMAQSLDLSSIYSLMLKLDHTPTRSPLWERLIDTITIGETYFFRNAYQFRAMTSDVFPEIIERKRLANARHLRIWSAGCATGEEPYSLAMLLRELIPDIDSWSIQILATDINTTSLAYAKKGFYKSRSFRNETRPDVQEKWFTERDGGWQVDPLVQKMVTFEPLNLVEDMYPASENQTAFQDLIICRNVTIYFDEATTRSIVERFNKSLIPGGWLVVGHAEPLVSTYQEFKPRNFENAVLYQKNENAPMFASAPPAAPVEVVAKPKVLPATSAPKPAPARIAAKPATDPLPAPKQQPVEIPLWQQAKEAADTGNWEAAIRLLELAERQTPMVPQVHYLHGLILIDQNAYDDAFQAFRRAIYCDPGFALAYYNLGELYAKRGDKPEALRYWSKSLKAVESLKATEYLPFGMELTAEMLRELVNHRISEKQ